GRTISLSTRPRCSPVASTSGLSVDPSRGLAVRIRCHEPRACGSAGNDCYSRNASADARAPTRGLGPTATRSGPALAPAVPGRPQHRLEVARKLRSVHDRRRLDALAKLSPQCGEPGGILDQLGRPLDVLILTPSDEVCETRVVQQRRAGARYGRAAREADDG